MRGDPGALTLARAVTDMSGHRWAFELLAAVATRLRLPDVAAEARARAATAPTGFTDLDDPDDANADKRNEEGL